MTIRYGAQYFFGLPDSPIEIPGFEVVVKPRHFATATDPEGNEYYIAEASDHYLLKPSKNCAKSESIRIEKPCTW